MATDVRHATVSRQRRAGVLLHPTSLPGSLGNGDFGHEAYRFIEFLSANGFKVWQMLPLGTTHDDKSPYQCLSSHAGNPLLISLDWLVDKGWLDLAQVNLHGSNDAYRLECLSYAFSVFNEHGDKRWKDGLADFSEENAYWLDDYAMFIALKQRYKNKPWYEWPAVIRDRTPAELKKIALALNEKIKQTVFEQFVFFSQWQEIRNYAKKFDIELFGDLPIFVALDSVDVWAQRENFLIGKDGKMEFIAGVPPDAFSETGQRWGNPLYDWDYLQSTNFKWWKQRIESQIKLFDMIRIDHFRGLQACWKIPQEEETAINGEWVEVPGREMLNELFDTMHHLPLVAEDLGVITDQVIELKEAFNFPGMKVLQFAFDGNNRNPHLPHNHQPGDIVYTGTHDNDTTRGWVSNDGNYNALYFNEYIGHEHKTIDHKCWSMIRLAMSSVSFLCVLPMQDLLFLGTAARMNMPGTTEGNWMWRFEWSQVNIESMSKISNFMTVYQR